MNTFPSCFFAKPVNLNNDEILIAPEKTQRDNSKGIYKYNIKTNKWNIFIEYDKTMEISYHTISIDKYKNILYSYDAQSHLIKINLKTKKLKISKRLFEKQYIDSSSIIIDNQFHLICGQNNNKHLIWNDNKQQFDEIYTFKEFDNGYSNNGLLYIYSKQMLLLFGGYDHTLKQMVDSIYCYSINNNQWTKLDINLPIKMKQFGYVLTRNEQYIIIFHQDMIYILDLHTMQFTTKKNSYYSLFANRWQFKYLHAILKYDCIKEEYLTFGYIRQCSNIVYPSNDIIKLIQIFSPSINAVIHLFTRYGDHLRIKLTDIIQGL